MRRTHRAAVTAPRDGHRRGFVALIDAPGATPGCRAAATPIQTPEM